MIEIDILGKICIEYIRKIEHNVLRIYEVRLNEIINYKQMLVGVSCIYAVIASLFKTKYYV
jgi:hypothetical protein